MFSPSATRYPCEAAHVGKAASGPRRDVVPRPARVERVERHRVDVAVAGFVVFPPSARGAEAALSHAAVCRRALVPLSRPGIGLHALDVQRGLPRLAQGVFHPIPRCVVAVRPALGVAFRSATGGLPRRA